MIVRKPKIESDVDEDQMRWENEGGNPGAYAYTHDDDEDKKNAMKTLSDLLKSYANK